MLSLVLLLAFAALVGTVGRRVLREAAWVQRAPRLGIWAWLAAATSVAIALLLAGFTLLLPDLHFSTDLARMVHACVAEVRERYSTPTGNALPWIVAAIAAVALVRLLIIGALEHGSTLWRRHVLRRDLAMVGRREPACEHSDDYVSLDESAALIYCVPGRKNATVVVTSGARSLLSHDELAAALRHERAHLRRRHHIPILVSRVLAVAFLQRGIFGEAATQVALLAEMDADDGARHMPGLQGALARLALASSPAAALGAGGGTVIQRLRRLQQSPVPLGLSARIAVRVGVAAVVVAPLAIALVPTVQALMFDCCGATTFL